MRTVDALGDLRRAGMPIVETAEASERLGVSTARASQILRTLSEAGLVRRLRSGLWDLEPPTSADVVATYLTAPFPAYVSLWSALARHGMIEQIPGRHFIASLDRPHTVSTAVGVFSIHHLAPEVFGGFTGTPSTGYVATPEKALFDTVYVRSPRGGDGLRLPELELPTPWDDEVIRYWLDRVTSPRLRTLTTRHLERILGRASVQPTPV